LMMHDGWNAQKNDVPIFRRSNLNKFKHIFILSNDCSFHIFFKFLLRVPFFVLYQTLFIHLR
jgi:hypothetical protein